MERKHNKSILKTARMLRKNLTREEKRLWFGFLRKYPVKFTRQKILGKYIADFYAAEVKLAVEVDGSGHYTQEGIEHDRERAEYLRQSFGVEIIRIPNADILIRFSEVCDFIDQAVRKAVQNKENRYMTPEELQN